MKIQGGYQPEGADGVPPLLPRTGSGVQAPINRGSAPCFGTSIFTKRPISHDEATEIAKRLINSHFRNEPHARASIPARPDYDDDLLILTYIHQQRAKEAAPIGAPGSVANV